jgi:hypothetical protein
VVSISFLNLTLLDFLYFGFVLVLLSVLLSSAFGPSIHISFMNWIDSGVVSFRLFGDLSVLGLLELFELGPSIQISFVLELFTTSVEMEDVEPDDDDLYLVLLEDMPILMRPRRFRLECARLSSLLCFGAHLGVEFA